MKQFYRKEDPVYNILVKISIILFILFSIWLIYDHFVKRPPEVKHYLKANNAFKDRDYELALQEYLSSLNYNNNDVYFLEGVARAYMELSFYKEAEQFFIKAINIDPNFGPAYANLGVLYDRQKKYELAITNYKLAYKLDTDLSKGMHWLDRLLYDVRETPATIIDRASYLEKQLSLPISERVLSIPNIDEQQYNYER